MSSVEIRNLTKTYGRIRAVDGFSLTAEKGEILALAGPDGAGKTTIFRAACGLITYAAGEIRIAGLDVSRELRKIKPLLGYMPQTFSLYPDLSVEENLSFYAGLFGLNRAAFEKKRSRLYEFSGLGPFRGRRASELSGGMKQKLALSCCLVHDPQVLILDEPTTGVDPLSRRQFWDILKDLKAAGSAILISTPYMDEVGLAEQAVFIYGGKELAKGTPAELTRHFKGRVYQVNVNPTSECMQELSQLEGIVPRRFGSTIHVYARPGDNIDYVRAKVAPMGMAGDAVEEVPAGLEDVFIQLMGK